MIADLFYNNVLLVSYCKICVEAYALCLLQGLAMAMHKNQEGPAVFEMLNEALELARREKRVTEERNIRILIAQMHVVEVVHLSYLLPLHC